MPRPPFQPKRSSTTTNPSRPSSSHPPSSYSYASPLLSSLRHPGFAAIRWHTLTEGVIDRSSLEDALTRVDLRLLSFTRNKQRIPLFLIQKKRALTLLQHAADSLVDAGRLELDYLVSSGQRSDTEAEDILSPPPTPSTPPIILSDYSPSYKPRTPPPSPSFKPRTPPPSSPSFKPRTPPLSPSDHSSLDTPPSSPPFKPFTPRHTRSSMSLPIVSRDDSGDVIILSNTEDEDAREGDDDDDYVPTQLMDDDEEY